MSSNHVDEVSRSRRLCLSSPSDLVSNWSSWEYVFILKLKSRKLYYLLADTPTKKENGLETSTASKLDNLDLFGALLVDVIHIDNIDLINHTTVPYAMWKSLESSHLWATSGTKFYYIRQMMVTRVEDDFDAITNHLLKVQKVGGRLQKLCKDGKISVDDLEIASLTTSLPSSYSSVTAPFERMEHSSPKEDTNAVRD